MRAWLRRNWKVPAVLSCIAAADVMFNAVWPVSSFVRGVLDGAIIVFFIGLVFVLAALASGSWHRLLGVAGESFTADEFLSRRRRRQGWRVFHGLRIGGQEIDHIAAGPGGVLAIETKFVGSGTWRVAADGTLAGAIRDPLKQARISATKASSFLGSSTGAGVDTRVVPVLIVWGPGCPELRDGHETLEHVEVFSGRDERAWRGWLDQNRLESDLYRAVSEALDRYAPLNLAADPSLA